MVELIVSHRIMDIPASFPPYVSALMQRCFVFDWKSRPTFVELAETLGRVNEQGLLTPRSQPDSMTDESLDTADTHSAGYIVMRTPAVVRPPAVNVSDV